MEAVHGSKFKALKLRSKELSISLINRDVMTSLGVRSIVRGLNVVTDSLHSWAYNSKELLTLNLELARYALGHAEFRAQKLPQL